MADSADPSLSFGEWLVLCVVCEQPRHGFAITLLCGSDGPLGQVWRVPKPVIYRGLQRLQNLGLVVAQQEPSSHGPVRSLVAATESGQRSAAAWLNRPARHNRDVRSELLAKLALLDRRQADPRPLLDAQREQLLPVAGALRDRLSESPGTTGFDRVLLLWRLETVSATLRFLDAVSDADHAPADRASDPDRASTAVPLADSSRL